MTRDEISQLSEGYAPVIREYVKRELAPLVARIEASEAAQATSARQVLDALKQSLGAPDETTRPVEHH